MKSKIIKFLKKLPGDASIEFYLGSRTRIFGKRGSVYACAASEKYFDDVMRAAVSQFLEQSHV